MSTKVLFVDPFYEGLAQNVEVVAWMMVIILVFNQHCWLSRERGCGGSLVCHSMSSPSLSTQSTFWTGGKCPLCVGSDDSELSMKSGTASPIAYYTTAYSRPTIQFSMYTYQPTNCNIQGEYRVYIKGAQSHTPITRRNPTIHIVTDFYSKPNPLCFLVHQSYSNNLFIKRSI